MNTYCYKVEVYLDELTTVCGVTIAESYQQAQNNLLSFYGEVQTESCWIGLVHDYSLVEMPENIMWGIYNDTIFESGGSN